MSVKKATNHCQLLQLVSKTVIKHFELANVQEKTLQPTWTI